MLFRYLLIGFCLFSLPSWAADPASLKAPVPLAKVDEKALCKGREGCRLLWTRAAGLDEKARPMYLSEVVLPSPKEWSCRRPPNDLNGEFIQDVHQEVWLTQEGGLLPDHKKILDFCNDGYGAAGVGEDVLTFADAVLTIRSYGGSALRWMNGTVLQLPSLRVLRTLGCASHSLFGGGEFISRDYETGAFRMGRTGEVRGEGQAPGQEDFINCEALTVADAQPRQQGIALKQISSFLGIRVHDIKVLGTCASAMTSRQGPHQGYVVYGQEDGSSVEVKALRINDDQLWVSIMDEGRTFNATANWDHDDRLEVWWLEEKKTSATVVSRRVLRQFIVRLADLAVFPGYGYSGKQELPYVDRREGKGLNFIIHWPAEQYPSSEGLTIALAHGNGRETAVMWASSMLKYGRSETLGPILRLQENGNDPMQSCAIDKDGVINLVRPTFSLPKGL